MYSINVDVNINDLLFGDRHVNFEVIVLYLLIFNFRQQGVSMNTSSRVRLIITQFCLCYFFLSLLFMFNQHQMTSNKFNVAYQSVDVSTN
jgi:hypothetical protein